MSDIRPHSVNAGVLLLDACQVLVNQGDHGAPG
jgi:hypothetical protein